MRIILALKGTDLRISIELLFSEEPGLLIVGSAIDTQGMLALIDASGPDLILLDCALPGEPLLEVIKAIQTCESPPSIILLGIESDPGSDIFQVGIDHYVQKGDPPEKLVEAFRQIGKS